MAALAGHVSRHKWSQARLISYLFSFDTPRVLYDEVGPRSGLAELYVQCVLGRPKAEREFTKKVLLELAGKRTELLARTELNKPLGQVIANYKYRRRDLAGWRPASKNPFRQLESLVRHLFDEYGDVPAWVINTWTEAQADDDGINTIDLTLHLGQGRSLRSFPGLPLPLSKKLEHYMRQAPGGCTFREALRYAQLASRDALEWLGPVLESRLGREKIQDDSFWMSVVDFFRATPLVDAQHFGPVCDWIYFKRSVGTATEPAQPNFSLKGRSMASVLAYTAAWHRQQARESRYDPYGYESATWPGLPVADFVGGVGDLVRITQLTSYRQLQEEGRRLGHCVASYWFSCQRGRCGIFSLTMGGTRCLTLEVSKNYTVVQARGKYNRSMNEQEQKWVLDWLEAARLSLSKHVA
ncbi:hypothetical protein GCM10023185_46550 [Hymenobacter saemangeumensis]|uniref:PcfJ-like protein n=2 Tax=Hymenobacter saemangeumensis TaxID=1084522 RepID=A0ABP8IT73_9BACT